MSALQDNDGNSEGPVLVSTYLGGRVESIRMSLAEYRCLNLPEVDCQLDLIRMYTRIVSWTNEPIEYHGSIPNVGEEVSWPFIQDLSWAPGVYFSGRDLARNPLLKSLQRSELLSACLKRVRRAFGESYRHQHFFCSTLRPFRVAWNAERTWRLIEYA